MREKDYYKIKKLIERERASGNIESLKQLRDFLNEQISLYQLISSSHQIDSGSKEWFDILELELEEFLTIHAHGFNFFTKNFVHAVEKIKGLKRTVLVFDSIGIGKTILLQEKGIGLRTIGKYENLLNRFGYSLDCPLPEQKEKKFKKYLKKIYDK